MPAQVRGLKVCFTLNNYTCSEQEVLTTHIDDGVAKGHIAYSCIGEECGEKNETIHLQGYIRLARGNADPRKCGINHWKGTPGLGRAHFETARGSDEDNQTYCSKDGIYQEWGTPGKGEGTVYAEVFELCKQDLETALNHNPELAIKHFGNIRSIAGHFNGSFKVDGPKELRSWQVNYATTLADSTPTAWDFNNNISRVLSDTRG